MIAYIKGILEEIEEDSVILEAGGIGYRVFTPVCEELIRVGIGNEVRLYTYFCVREDAQILYGFLRRETLRFFKMLINVNGVGPRYAMGILSQLPEDGVALAISTGDYKYLTRVSGIGTKTAQRIVVDLKDKVHPSEAGSSETAFVPTAAAAEEKHGEAADAALVLQSLGLGKADAEKLVSRVYAPGKDAAAMVNEALALWN